ncbi:MAG: response regulator transcription factor [Parabacteroides distasonis]|nr:response regulator transcription factor [Parabacteroides distasonis]
MKVVIIEDEVAAYANIKKLLASIEPEAEIVAYLDTVADSIVWFQSNALPDLIFMDIQLADGSAFHIFDSITLDVPVIFTTAYGQYAIKAFEVNSIDYLLKPITYEAVQKVLQKYKKTNPEVSSPSDPFTWSTEHIKRLLIPFRDKILPIKTEDIAYFYNTNGKTSLITKEGQTYCLNKSLDTLMVRLDNRLFYRANRQFIVSREEIDSFIVWGDNRLQLQIKQPTEEPIIVAKNKAAEFKEWLMAY